MLAFPKFSECEGWSETSLKRGEGGGARRLGSWFHGVTGWRHGMVIMHYGLT